MRIFDAGGLTHESLLQGLSRDVVVVDRELVAPALESVGDVPVDDHVRGEPFEKWPLVQVLGKGHPHVGAEDLHPLVQDVSCTAGCNLAGITEAVGEEEEDDEGCQGQYYKPCYDPSHNLRHWNSRHTSYS